MKRKVCVIVPVFNEDCAVVKETVNNLSKLGYTIIVVDDGNEVPIYNYLKDFPVHCLRHIVNLGQGAALQTGVEYGKKIGGNIFVTFDADGQHNVSDIDKMIDFMSIKQVDIVFGSRFLSRRSAMGFKRRLVLKVANFVNFFLTRVQMSDSHNGLRVFNLNGSSIFRFKEDRMAHATEILINLRNADLPFLEFPIEIFYSEYAKQKGQKNIDAIFIMKELLMYKIFQ